MFPSSNEWRMPQDDVGEQQQSHEQYVIMETFLWLNTLIVSTPRSKSSNSEIRSHVGCDPKTMTKTTPGELCQSCHVFSRIAIKACYYTRDGDFRTWKLIIKGRHRPQAKATLFKMDVYKE
ncbi:uncharacterized protein CLUP02_04623 [Colletotrichum lupini]|uniref:Uncharacterized protein n=1 Tax=Colletotrichum lupini TaxID=145971 RepID=A0A9Q8SKN8_9PEZI|nr:uncharacterized protein CLUP02_04623 [Colletotrichum lupini]UQC79144.1 hypothetical protein CLUP02_04623 [Colletotrichum lupini]